MQSNIYEPNKYIKLGIRIWPEMFSELFQSRELIWRLFIRNLSVKYKQAVLGSFWILLMPFVAIGTFMFLNRSGILNIENTNMPYPLFALIGLSVWQIFSTGITSGCNSLVGAGDMITKVNFPREALVFSSIAQSLFEFGVKSCLIVVFFFVFKFTPSWGIILLPIALIPILFLTLGLSLILSLVNGVLRDTANVVTLLVTFLMFLTPVLYPIKEGKSALFKLNIFTSLINTPRELITTGTVKEPLDFLIASAISFLVFFVSWRVFHLVETKIPERI